MKQNKLLGTPHPTYRPTLSNVPKDSTTVHQPKKTNDETGKQQNYDTTT